MSSSTNVPLIFTAVDGDDVTGREEPLELCEWRIEGDPSEGRTELEAPGMVFSSKKKLETTNIESLPEDIIFNILARVPAQDICNSAFFVCRTWHRVMRTRAFVRAHLQQSTPGLLIPQKVGCQPVFLATPKGQIEISNFNCNITGRVISSCNGLVLESRDDNWRDLYIKNPSTKQHLALPSFVWPYPRPQCCGMAYDAANMEYKVVRMFYSRTPVNLECAILTVGVDTDWGRRVDTQNVTLAASYYIEEDHSRPSLTTQGFVHWTNTGCSDFLSLNVETEVITQFSVPAAASRHDGSGARYFYLAMGSNVLSLLVKQRGGWSWDVWEMRPETGEWTQMPNIHLDKLQHLVSPRRGSIVPVGWSSFREVLVFRITLDLLACFRIAYNVRTQEIFSTELDAQLGSYIPAHKNSLAWL